ncbi:hypothetical protein OSB04_029372 [Centaurea solstitialis]|uniref:Uncharacterized protein n=1 Tax=Centaurea solstitialis TaxID=347529 RepID=A0AA38SVV5_9ASTR|nr:hypothetical protein OSB04_029372 [Centaurea solstitialis]
MIPSIIRPRSAVTLAEIPRDSAGTGRVGASGDALRGSAGSPDTVNIIPAVTSGRDSTSVGLFSTTGAQAALGLVLLGPGPTDSSEVSKDAHATPGLLGLTDSGGIPKTTPVPTGLSGPTDSDDILKVVHSRLLAMEEANRARDARVEALEKALAETERKRMADLEASRKLQEDRDAELYELKWRMKGKHSEAAPSTEARIPRQSEDVLKLAPPTSGDLPFIPGYVTEVEHSMMITSYTTQNDRLSAQVRERDAQIELLQQRIRELEAMCRSQAQPSKRRHDNLMTRHQVLMRGRCKLHPKGFAPTSILPSVPAPHPHQHQRLLARVLHQNLLPPTLSMLIQIRRRFLIWGVGTTSRSRQVSGESHFIKKIVKEILGGIQPDGVETNLIGIESHIDALNSLFCKKETKEV